jgi:hypothetical protein
MDADEISSTVITSRKRMPGWCSDMARMVLLIGI